jgi:hypothetical protein
MLTGDQFEQAYHRLLDGDGHCYNRFYINGSKLYYLQDREAWIDAHKQTYARLVEVLQ